jgi:histidine ammonia-lyase
MAEDSRVIVGREGTSLAELADVMDGSAVELSSAALEALGEGRRMVEGHLGDDRPIYGVNTGFGRLANAVVDHESLQRLQRNLLRSHSCGTGPLFGEHLVRGMLFLRIASLCRGRSGVRRETVEQMLAFLNGPVLPAVPTKGSLGASGDLAPLAHLSLPLIGEGYCVHDEELVSGATALEMLGREPIELGAKEGLALINGTQVLTATTAVALLRAARIADAADVALAMSLEVLMGTTAAFDPELLDLRPHPGAAAAGRNVRAMMEASEILESHRNCSRVQDAYSLRCAPQVHGASRDAMAYVETVLATELRSVTDNPLLMEDGRVVSGGNFHGQPVALAADHLGLAASELGSISERRIERLLNPDLSGLPAFLAPDPGVNSGLMIAQYTAASLASENKVLCHPSSCDSIPVSASQEDHVSMGAAAARHALEITANVRRIVATELLCAAQAYEFVDAGAFGLGTGIAYEQIRSVVPPLGEDRVLDRDTDMVEEMIEAGAFSRLLASL